MKTVKLLSAFAAFALLSACNGGNTRIDGILNGADGGTVSFRVLDGSRHKILDSVKVGKDGSYRYAFDIAKGDPEFVYIYRNGRQLASLLLEAGDRVKVVSDTVAYLSDYTVSGSEASELLRQVEKSHAAFRLDLDRIIQQYAAADGHPDRMQEVQAEVRKCYIDYYRDRVKYVLSHAHSLTVVPVLFQELDGASIFNQPTDALLYRAAADSLKKLYPASRFVKALDKEATRRAQMMDMDYRIRNAAEASYVDIELPDMQGNKQKLSETGGKLVMLYFWTTADAVQKMFNIDQMLPVYKDFHAKGLEIYAVSFDTDKAAWAAAVRGQELPWVNVCDTRGAASPYLSVYNVQGLPAVYFLLDGELILEKTITDAQALRRFLSSRLK